MASLFPREEHAEALFHRILSNPGAEQQLYETFCMEQENASFEDGGGAECSFAKALLQAYENRDISALTIALCNNTMFDLLRTAYLIPYRFHGKNGGNPRLLTDANGEVREEYRNAVSARELRKFHDIYRQHLSVPRAALYLADGSHLRHKYTKDMLMSVPLPSPYPNITRNDGEMSNQGFEITLSSVNIARKDFNWSTDLNVSLNRNKVEKLNLKQVYYYATTSDATNDNVVRMTPGHPLSMFWGYVSKGVDPETGDLVYEDRNGDGEITPLDKTWIGNANPKFTFGMTNNFSWKGLNLNILITGSYGNDIFNASRIETEGMASANNQTTTVLRRWRIPGQQTDVFRSDNPAWNVKNSSYWVEDGSYLKVKNITLSYDITSPKLKRINITRIQPYISLQNFITWTGYSGYDPEVSQSESATQMGIDWGTYPNVRTVVVGLNLTF